MPMGDPPRAHIVVIADGKPQFSIPLTTPCEACKSPDHGSFRTGEFEIVCGAGIDVARYERGAPPKIEPDDFFVPIRRFSKEDVLAASRAMLAGAGQPRLPSEPHTVVGPPDVESGWIPDRGARVQRQIDLRGTAFIDASGNVLDPDKIRTGSNPSVSIEGRSISGVRNLKPPAEPKPEHDGLNRAERRARASRDRKSRR